MVSIRKSTFSTSPSSCLVPTRPTGLLKLRGTPCSLPLLLNRSSNTEPSAPEATICPSCMVPAIHLHREIQDRAACPVRRQLIFETPVRVKRQERCPSPGRKPAELNGGGSPCLVHGHRFRRHLEMQFTANLNGNGSRSWRHRLEHRAASQRRFLHRQIQRLALVRFVNYNQEPPL